MNLKLNLIRTDHQFPNENRSILVRYRNSGSWEVLDYQKISHRWQVGELHYDVDEIVEKFSHWAQLPEAKTLMDTLLGEL